jgi:hypothetical protein
MVQDMQYCHGKRNILQEKDSFHQQIGLKFKEESSEVLYMRRRLVMALKLGYYGK